MIGDIIQNLISQLGQSQNERVAKELQPHFADVDDRTPSDQLVFVQRLSRFVRYYRGSAIAAAGDWEPFFNTYDDASAGELLASPSGTTTPHLALLIAFLKLHELPRGVLNRLTAGHLDFFYRRVLRFELSPAAPDRAHVVVELKKNAPAVAITPQHLLSAGKDAAGVELVYAPVRETVVNAAKVDRLCSQFIDRRGRGTVLFAPIANSSDGVGGALTPEQPTWAPFGHEGLTAGEVGFALASPVLRMKEGERKVSLSLTLSELGGASPEALGGVLQVFVTGEKSWLGPYAPTPRPSSDVLNLDFTIPATDGAVVDYAQAIHGYSYAAEAPVVQVLLKPGHAQMGYDDARGIVLRRARVSVDVSGVASLALESDQGILDPKKVFLPFGAQPVRGSRFMIGCPEALSKDLSEIVLTIQWHGLPTNLASHYADYGVANVGGDDFTAIAAFQDRGPTDETSSMKVQLFAGSSGQSVIKLIPGKQVSGPSFASAANVHALRSAGSAWAQAAAVQLVRRSPVLTPFITRVPDVRSDFITLSLDRDFLHERYRKKTIENVVTFSKTGGTLRVLNEPYTPAIGGLSLAYKAQSAEVDVQTPTLDAFAQADVRFFHVDCFGQRREHAYQRKQFDFVEPRVPLFPGHTHQGELMVGLTGLRAGDSVSVLFQVAEGSAHPDALPPDVEWFALCDNYWKRLGASDRVLDTTNQLLTSGLLGFVLPRETTTVNSVMPAGRVWLKAAVAQNATATSRLLTVTANAVEVQLHQDRKDIREDPPHLGTPLPAGRIVKLKTPIPGVKGVAQPYASFAGRRKETAAAFQTRASERLRHKDRALSPWDYERIVLGGFPNVHKVKCIPHAREGSWLAPGHVLLVVVPDLRNANARDPLQPKVDADTIDRITSHLQERVGMQVQVKVKNPSYQKIRLDFKVRFHVGYEFNHYSQQLEQELIAFLSPWTHDAVRPISFGGRIFRSVLLDFVEERPYVDYVVDFKLLSYTDRLEDAVDVGAVSASTPDAILVSDSGHTVREA